MGRKVHPVGFRLGVSSDWESKWFAEKQYTELLHEDIAIRNLVEQELQRAGVARIELERSANKVDVTLHTAKPGIVIGKQGANVERIRGLIEKKVGKKVNQIWLLTSIKLLQKKNYSVEWWLIPHS